MMRHCNVAMLQFRRAPPPKNRSKARRLLNNRVAKKDERLLDGSDVKEEDEDCTDVAMTSPRGASSDVQVENKGDRNAVVTCNDDKSSSG